MKRSVLVWTSALALLASSASWALSSGSTLYVRARDTRLYKDAEGAKPYAYTLQPGDALTWLEHATGSKYHKVKSAKGEVGYVLYNTVSTTAPQPEVMVGKSDEGKAVDAQAFASYGAAARGLTEESKKSAQHAPDPKAAEKAAGDLERVEKIARSVAPAPSTRSAQ